MWHGACTVGSLADRQQVPRQTDRVAGAIDEARNDGFVSKVVKNFVTGFVTIGLNS
jgi:hypothetical protein